MEANMKAYYKSYEIEYHKIMHIPGYGPLLSLFPVDIFWRVYSSFIDVMHDNMLQHLSNWIP